MKIYRRKKNSSAKARRPLAAGTSLLAVVLNVSLPVLEAADQNLGDLSLEELMNESVTSVSKREQKLTDAAASITVLTNEDIRRSGATTIPDALRLVPGVNVGAGNSREFAVSARGFNSVFSNKQLVLVDGRVVYTALFAGVYWDLQQTMMEDLDRIEVIRGPGATVWGANAVNGVINVVTRSARDTLGGVLYGGAGNVHEAMAGMRYGGQVGENTYYRVFASQQSNDDYPLANGQPAGDAWNGWRGGFRVDHYPDAKTHVTWQADGTGMEDEAGISDGYNANTLGRWSRQLSERSSVEVQAFYDRLYRNETHRSGSRSDTFDIEAHHTFGLGEYHNIIWGLGYRYIDDNLRQTTPLVSLRTGNYRQRLFSGFVQDEFQFIPARLILTAGLKVEHNDTTGFEFQPSVRAVFKPATTQTIWTAVSRAVRTPDSVRSRDLFGIPFGPPAPGPGGGIYLPLIVGNPALKSEVLLAYEAGYRIQPAKWISVDLTAFHHDYRDLITSGQSASYFPGSPVGYAEFPWANSLTSQLSGAEAVVVISPTDTWRLTASYGLLLQQIQGITPANAGETPKPPRHQVVLRSSHDLTKSTGLDLQLRYVDALAGVPAYLTADFHLSYRPDERLELSLVGQNLLDDQHLEQAVSILTASSEVPRSFYGKITWRF